MSFLATLKKLDLNQNPTAPLSLNSDQIKALQSLLDKLGYATTIDDEERGTYGATTTAAIASYLQKKKLPGDGSFVTPIIIQQLVDLEKNVTHLKVIRKLLDKGLVEEKLFRKSDAKNDIIALQNCLYLLGFGTALNWERFGADGDYGGSTTNALKAFGRREGIPVTGERMTTDLADRMLGVLGEGLGDDWTGFNPVNQSFNFDQLLIDITKRGSKAYHQITDGFLTLVLKPYSRGFFTTGAQQVSDFIDSEEGNVNLTNSCRNMIVAVSENEGKLDAINTWDNSFLSLGMYQWTLGAKHTKGELPALLKKIKEADETVFHFLFGQYGLDVSDDTNSTYGFLILNGEKLDKILLKEPFRKEQWAYTFWRAGHHPLVKRVQIEHAVARLKNFYWRDKANGISLSKIITSEYGVALILDNHVNRPAYVKKCIEKAMLSTGLINPESWGTAEENKVINAYLEIRQFHPFDVDYPMSDREKNRPMTHAKIRENRTRKRMEKGLLSKERGSFVFEHSLVTRSLEKIKMTMAIPKPSNFKQKNYPVIK